METLDKLKEIINDISKLNLKEKIDIINKIKSVAASTL